MVRTTNVDVEAALGEDRLGTLAADLDRLPSATRFEAAVTDAVWELVAGEAADRDAVVFAELPQKGADLFGLVETPAGETRLPWWFESFRWTVREPDIRGVVIDDPDSLRDIENLDPTRASVERPELRTDFVDVLEAAKRLRAELGRHLSADPGDPTIGEFPDRPFERREGGIRTTDEFAGWFEDVVALCPPANETLTALLTANSNVRWEIARQVLAGDLLDRFEAVGLRDAGTSGEDRVFNWTYHESLVTLVRLSGVFDLSLSDGDGPLAPPERALYEGWAGAAEVDGDLHRWVSAVAGYGQESLDPVEEREFAAVAFDAPLRLDRAVPVFATLDEGEFGDRKTAVEDLLEAEGVVVGDE